jgi:hypothetical protein
MDFRQRNYSVYLPTPHPNPQQKPQDVNTVRFIKKTCHHLMDFYAFFYYFKTYVDYKGKDLLSNLFCAHIVNSAVGIKNSPS